MEIDLHFAIKLTEKQQDAYNSFHSDKYNELVLNFSRQSGKTTLAEILCIETLCRKKCNVAYISPDYSQGKKVFREICQLLETTKLIKKKNSSDLTLELINGSVLLFFTAKNPTAIRGNTISGLLILDECAYLPETTPDGQLLWSMVIKPITKAKKPKTIFISTPNGKTGFFYEKYLEGLKEESKVKTIECNIYNDTTITKEEIDELREITPPLAWKQEFMCEFLDSALTVFEGFEHSFVDYNERKLKCEGKCWIGIDFSTSGEDETILTKQYQNGTVSQYKITGTLDQKYAKIAEIINNEKNLVMCYAESNSIGEPIINEIRKLVNNKSKVIYHTTTHDNKNASVGELSLAISNGEVYFNKEDRELYGQMGVFTYNINKKTRSITYAAKPPYHDDRVMSLLLARQAKEEYPNTSVQSNYRFVASVNKTIR